MANPQHNKKHTAFFFGEGRQERKFLEALTGLKKFKDHTKNWSVNCDNGHGGSPEDILLLCCSKTINVSYDVVLCLVDLDVLKRNDPKDFSKKVSELEEKYSGRIIIVWQEDNAEDEYREVLGSKAKDKNKYDLDALAITNIAKFINTKLWYKILRTLTEKEAELIQKKRANGMLDN